MVQVTPHANTNTVQGANDETAGLSRQVLVLLVLFLWRLYVGIIVILACVENRITDSFMVQGSSRPDIPIHFIFRLLME